MSNAADKKVVKAEWDASRIRAETLKSVVNIYKSLETVLEKDAETADEAAKAILVNRQYYEALDIDSPKTLAQAIAEYTTNLLGIKVSTVENGGKSTIVFEGGAFVNKVAALDLSSEVSNKLIRAYRNGLADLGGYYGFRTELSSVQPDFIVSFSK